MSDNMENTVEETVDTPVETEAEKTFTQSELERVVEQRLMRERKKYEKKMEGIDLDEARQLMQEKEAAEIERQKEKGEFEKVLQQLAEKKDQQINALNAKLHETLVDGALLKAASSQNAVAPDQVVALLKNKVKLADDGNVEVLDDSGSPRYTDDGTPMSVNALVSDYLTANPHFVRASSGGAGSQGAAGGSTQKPLSVADMVANWETGGREAFAAMKGKR